MIVLTCLGLFVRGKMLEWEKNCNNSWTLWRWRQLSVWKDPVSTPHRGFFFCTWCWQIFAFYLTEGKGVWKESGLSLTGDCHEVQVTPKLEFLATFGMSMEGACHDFTSNSQLIWRWLKIPWQKLSLLIRCEKVMSLEWGWSLNKFLPSESNYHFGQIFKILWEQKIYNNRLNYLTLLPYFRIRHAFPILCCHISI
jgi:hypothetical protein